MAPAVFAVVGVGFAGIVVMCTTGVAGLTMPFGAALVCGFISDRGRVGLRGRLGGTFLLRRGDILGLCQRSDAEQGNEGAEHEGLAHGGISWLVCRPPIRPATGALLADTADNDLLTDVSELSGDLCGVTRKELGPAMRLNSKGLAVALLSLAALAASARADDDRDHDVARHAVERGEIKPLAEILQMVRDKLPGEIAGVKIERKGRRLVYELRIVSGRGRLLEVHVDAATGEIDRTREK